MKILVSLAFCLFFFCNLNAQIQTSFEPSFEIEANQGSFTIPQKFLPAKVIFNGVTYHIFEDDEKILYNMESDSTVEIFLTKEKNGVLVTDCLPIYATLCTETEALSLKN